MTSEVNLKFVSAFSVCPEDSDLQCVLEKLDECNSDAQHKELIDIVLNRYCEDHEGVSGSHVRNVMIELFSKTCPKKNLRKYMFEKLNSLRIRDKTLFEYIVGDVTQEIRDNIDRLKIFRIKQCFQMLCFLFSYTQNFTNNNKYEYLVENTFPFYLCIMEVFASQLYSSKCNRDGCEERNILEYEDCYSVLSNTLKQLVLAVPRTFHKSFISNSTRMVILTHTMLKCHAQLKFETISKCGLLFAYFLNILPSEEREFLKWKDAPILDFVDNESSRFCLVLKTKQLPNLFETDRMKVVLNMAVYNSLTAKTLLERRVGEKPLLEILYVDTLRLGTQMSSHPEQIVQISRTIEGMAAHLAQLPTFDEVFAEGLKFCWVHLDHFVEHVTTTTKSITAILIKQAMQRFEKGETRHLQLFFRELHSMSIFSKVRVGALHAISETMPSDYVIAYCPQVQNQLLMLMANSTHHDTAGHIYVQLMKKHLNDLPEEEAARLWLRPVLNILKKPMVKYGPVFERIVTFAFQSRPTLFRKLFNAKAAGTVAECAIVLKCIHYARLNGIKLAEGCDFWRDLIVKSKMEMFMVHQDEEIRISALQCVAECQKSTEEFQEWELAYLIKYFLYNVSTQIPNIRNRIVTYYKKIFFRYQASYAILTKRIVTLEHYGRETELALNQLTVQQYKSFLFNFVQILVQNLGPDSNYSRRSISLELLILVHNLNDAAQWQVFFSQDEVANVKHLLNDGYESNKSMAVSVLKTLPPRKVGFESAESTRKFFEKCSKMAVDVRPSQSLSACYMFQLLLQSEFPFKNHEKGALEMTNDKQCLLLFAMIDKMESMFRSSKGDVMEAAKSTPFYGLLLSTRHLLRNRDIRGTNGVYRAIFVKLATLCLALKTHIMPIVCASSPEGHLPEGEDLDDSFLECDQSSKAQMILVYSWKTMKEIMLVLAELANQTVALENVIQMLSEEYLLNIGDFFMDIFIQTKHRGVFEQAHVAFTTICRCFVFSKNSNLNKLPIKWLNEAVALCTGRKTDDRLCPTRRSAGLPFLILSILPSLSNEHLRKTIEPLLATATSDLNDELRMHCLNVLRFMFNNSKLSDTTAIYIDRGAIASLLGFRSHKWGVRNSATLLLSALIRKIFGVPKASVEDVLEVGDDNRMTLAVFYMRFRRLFDFLLEMVEEECAKVDSLILHPVLLILSRLYPSHNDKINSQVKRHVPFINICIKNPSYRTRDLAARASISLISENCLVGQLKENFDRIGDDAIGDTECHGLLLQVRHIFHTAVFEELPISEYLSKSLHLLTKAGSRFSHLTVTLYMDIVFMMLSKYRHYDDLGLLKKLVTVIFEQKADVCLSTSQTSYSWSRFQLLIFVLLNKFQHVSATYDIITRTMISALYGRDIEMKKKCLQLLIYLNQQYSNDQYKEHPLQVAKEVEIPLLIKALTHSLDFKSRKELLTYTHPYLISYIYSEFKMEAAQNSDHIVLIFLLIRFYPCVFANFRSDKQKILNWLFYIAKTHNEEVASAVISCLKTFLVSLTPEELKPLSFHDCIKLLMDSAAPGAADYRRLSVAQFLVGIQDLFKCNIFDEFVRYNVLNVVMVLLEDDEAIVRNTISTFLTKHDEWQATPNSVRSILLTCSTANFRNETAICCLASWAIRRLPEVTADASEVYERGELNIYAENIPVTRCASEVLHELLWTLGEVLTYEDRSIFLEEQTLLVTTVVLNSLIKVPSPMVDRQTKRTVICVLKCVARFLEDCNVGKEFPGSFRTFFNAKILKFLRASLKTDYSSVKAFLTYLYNPVLETHFRFPQ